MAGARTQRRSQRQPRLGRSGARAARPPNDDGPIRLRFRQNQSSLRWMLIDRRRRRRTSSRIASSSAASAAAATATSRITAASALAARRCLGLCLGDRLGLGLGLGSRARRQQKKKVIHSCVATLVPPFTSSFRQRTNCRILVGACTRAFMCGT